MKINRKEQQLIYDLLAWCCAENVSAANNVLWDLTMKLEGRDLDETYNRIKFKKTNRRGETKVYGSDSVADISIVIGD